MSAAMVRQPQDRSGLIAAVPGRLEVFAAMALAAVAAISLATAVSSRVLSAGGAVRHRDALSVRNSAQGLAAGFSPTGVSVSLGSARVTLSLDGLGYGTRLAPVPAVPPVPARNRVIYTRRGLAEWYVNGPLGIEQGFTIDAPPAGSATGRLTLALSVGGSLRARLGSSRAVEFVSSGSGPGQFGSSVALSADGSTALVGGPQDDNGAGAVWVFTRSGGAWSQQGPKLTAGDEGGASSSARAWRCRPTAARRSSADPRTTATPAPRGYAPARARSG
jgi:hypothetical protein